MWLAYANTKELTDKSSLLEYAQNQSIVIGKLDSETLAFTEVKVYDGVGYAHMQRLALMNGVPTLAWVDTGLTDVNSVLVSKDNTVYVASYKENLWGEASICGEIKHPVTQIAIGDIGIAAVVDLDDDLLTSEDYTLYCYDMQGISTEIASGVNGKVCYAVLPTETEASFIWNGEGELCNAANSVQVAGITSEYVILGNDIYYSSATGEGTELTVVRKNSDGTVSNPIYLTKSGRYLENLSVVTVEGEDIVFGMDTAAEITETDVILNKNLVWAVVQPADDVRIDVVDYDYNMATAGETMPVNLTVLNAGDHDVDEVQISVNDVVVATEVVKLAAGQSKDMTIQLTFPESLTEYKIQVVDTQCGLEGDYTPEDNRQILKLGYSNICVDAHLQQIGKNRSVVAEVSNTGTEPVSGQVKLYNASGRLLGWRSFKDLASGDCVIINMDLFSGEAEGTLTVEASTEQEELYTFDNSADVFLPGEKVELETYNITYELNGGTQNEANPKTYQKSELDIMLAVPSREGYQFVGWYTDAAFTEQVTVIAAGCTGDVELYAKWEAITYSIEFAGNGADIGRMESMAELEYGTAYKLSKNVYEKEGYTFAGWNTQPDGSGEAYADEVEVKSLVSEAGGKVILYAQWKLVDYTIEYYINGGIQDNTNPTNYTVNTPTFTIKAPVRCGYSFDGWYTNNEFKEKVSESIVQGSTGNKQLYAKWTANGADHAWDEGKVMVEPTGNTAGKRVHTCEVCEETKEVIIPALISIPKKPYKIVNVVSGVHVYWEQVEGATKYGLWRSETGKDGTYKWIANPTIPHFTDTKVTSGKTYYYKVTVLDTDKNIHGGKSETIGITFVSTPDISLRVNRAVGVGLGWEKIPGATGYAIYRKSYEGKEDWVRVATIQGADTLSWNDTSVKNENGKVYRYTIRALTGSKNDILSGCRPQGRTMVRLTSRSLTGAVKTSATAIKCTWSTTSQATGYEVRFMTGDKVYKTFVIGNYKTGVKTFSELKGGQSYKIQVRSYKKVEGVGSFYSAWSTAKVVNL